MNRTQLATRLILDSIDSVVTRLGMKGEITDIEEKGTFADNEDNEERGRRFGSSSMEKIYSKSCKNACEYNSDGDLETLKSGNVNKGTSSVREGSLLASIGCNV